MDPDRANGGDSVDIKALRSAARMGSTQLSTTRYLVPAEFSVSLTYNILKIGGMLFNASVG